MSNPLDQLPLDKSHHFIGGAVIGALAAVASRYVHISPWQAAAGSALISGIAKEVIDAVVNYKATGKLMGEPRGSPHGVEAYDALATALGGFVVAVPLF